MYEYIHHSTVAGLCTSIYNQFRFTYTLHCVPSRDCLCGGYQYQLEFIYFSIIHTSKIWFGVKVKGEGTLYFPRYSYIQRYTAE